MTKEEKREKMMLEHTVMNHYPISSKMADRLLFLRKKEKEEKCWFTSQK
jgi:hypothetical protein